MRHFDLEHHDRDDDRQHPVAERFQPVSVHRAKLSGGWAKVIPSITPAAEGLTLNGANSHLCESVSVCGFGSPKQNLGLVGAMLPGVEAQNHGWTQKDTDEQGWGR